MVGYHVPVGDVPDSDEANASPVPHVILEAKPGVSEARFLWDVNRMQALIARHGTLVDQFAELRAATGSSVLKKSLTVMTLVQFLAPVLPPSDLALVFDLFPPLGAKLYGEVARGMIAASVAVLRSADLANSQIEQWLSEEIKRRSLDFTAGNVMRWFFDCNSKKAPVPPGMLEAFRFFQPGPSQSPTEAEAKKLAADMLNTAATMKAGPLTQAPRRRG